MNQLQMVQATKLRGINRRMDIIEEDEIKAEDEGEEADEGGERRGRSSDDAVVGGFWLECWRTIQQSRHKLVWANWLGFSEELWLARAFSKPVGIRLASLDT